MAPGNSTNDSTSDEIQISVEQLLKEKLPADEHMFEPILLPSECCIYKVPETLKNENVDDYAPHFISIGPIHHKTDKLKHMEKQKILYFRHFRARGDETVEALEGYKKYLEAQEDKIRKCYSEKYTSLNNEFVDMILLDAVFIMELFLRKYEREKGERQVNDYVFVKSWLNNGIERDLLLAENQLPFFVLEELYNRFKTKHNDGFLELARWYFKTYDPYHEKAVEKVNGLFKPNWVEPKHFTDLIRFFHVPNNLIVESPDRFVIKGAGKLKGAGIHFEHVSGKCLLDVTFEKKPFLNWLPFLSCLPCLNCVKARLKFPQLIVNDSTGYVLRNLMAFEQCHYPQHLYICSYAFLLDMIISEEKDVDVLVESGVIVNELSSDIDLAGLINNLCKNIVISSPSYVRLAKDLDDHYMNRWNKTVAYLRLVYFSNLWIGTGTIVGLLILIMTVFNFIHSNIELFSKMSIYEYLA